MSGEHMQFRSAKKKSYFMFLFYTQSGTNNTVIVSIYTRKGLYF